MSPALGDAEKSLQRNCSVLCCFSDYRCLGSFLAYATTAKSAIYIQQIHQVYGYFFKKPWSL